MKTLITTLAVVAATLVAAPAYAAPTGYAECESAPITMKSSTTDPCPSPAADLPVGSNHPIRKHCGKFPTYVSCDDGPISRGGRPVVRR